MGGLIAYEHRCAAASSLEWGHGWLSLFDTTIEGTAVTDFHQHMVAKAQERLRTARAEHEAFASRMDWSDQRAVKHLANLKRGGTRRTELANAEHSLRGVQAMQRAVALGM